VFPLRSLVGKLEILLSSSPPLGRRRVFRRHGAVRRMLDFDGTQRDHAGVDVFDGASAM
jgi:hypothetical protein